MLLDVTAALEISAAVGCDCSVSILWIMLIEVSDNCSAVGTSFGCSLVGDASSCELLLVESSLEDWSVLLTSTSIITVGMIRKIKIKFDYLYIILFSVIAIFPKAYEGRINRK